MGELMAQIESAWGSNPIIGGRAALNVRASKQPFADDASSFRDQSNRAKRVAADDTEAMMARWQVDDDCLHSGLEKRVLPAGGWSVGGKTRTHLLVLGAVFPFRFVFSAGYQPPLS